MPLRKLFRKTKDSRLKQLEYWKQFCEKTCNLMWAKRFAFSIVSSRVSFRGRLTAIWSSEPVKSTQQRVISNPVGCVDNDIARIASLAVYSRSAEFLDQVIYCAKDCRASIIDDLWALLLSDFCVILPGRHVTNTHSTTKFRKSPLNQPVLSALISHLFANCGPMCCRIWAAYFLVSITNRIWMSILFGLRTWERQRFQLVIMQ